MKPKWQKLASLAQEICTHYIQFFGAVVASKGYPFKNTFVTNNSLDRILLVLQCCSLECDTFSSLITCSTGSTDMPENC